MKSSILAFLVCLSFSGAAFSQQAQPITPDDAIKAIGVCDEHAGERTTRVAMINNTDWRLVIAFVQVKDRSNNVPDGFITDTGTFVLATDEPGNTTYAADPCFAGGSQRPIQGTWADATAKLTDGNVEVDLEFSEIVTDDENTTYFGEAWFQIDYQEGRPAVISNIRTK